MQIYICRYFKSTTKVNEMYSGCTMVMRNGGFEIFFWGVGELFGTIKFMNLFFRRASDGTNFKSKETCVDLIEVENAAPLSLSLSPSRVPKETDHAPKVVFFNVSTVSPEWLIRWQK